MMLKKEKCDIILETLSNIFRFQNKGKFNEEVEL